MKNLYFIPLLLLSTFLATAQQETFKPCRSGKLKAEYYVFKAKYPVSSETLVKEANSVVASQPKNVNGFVTIRFMVNCEGKIGDYKIYQVDNSYQPIVFEQTYVEQLLTFVKNLTSWKVATYNEKIFDYKTYLTFKIEHGNITEIVP